MVPLPNIPVVEAGDGLLWEKYLIVCGLLNKIKYKILNKSNLLLFGVLYETDP